MDKPRIIYGGSECDTPNNLRVCYENTAQDDQAIIEFYNELISGVEANQTRGDYMSRYQIEDYHAANNNCATVSLDGLEQGIPQELFDAINNADFNDSRGLTLTQRLAFRAAYDGDGISLPLDLKESILDQDGYIIENTYSREGVISRPNDQD